jgi:hypothetical protein
VKAILEGEFWTSGEFKVSGVALVETRSHGGAVGASMPIRLGGRTIRIGGGAPVGRGSMTVIDHGAFTFGPKAAHFVGSKHTRKWEYKAITGYVTTGSNELLIGVSNRQKMSGVRYSPEHDARMDGYLRAKLLEFEGGSAKAWFQQVIDETKASIAAAQQGLHEKAIVLIKELQDLDASHEQLTAWAAEVGLQLTVRD